MDNTPNPQSFVPPCVQPVYLPETYTFAADMLEDILQLMVDEGAPLDRFQRGYFTRAASMYRRMALVQ